MSNWWEPLAKTTQSEHWTIERSSADRAIQFVTMADKGKLKITQVAVNKLKVRMQKE